MSRRVTERIKARESKTLGKAAVEEMVQKMADAGEPVHLTGHVVAEQPKKPKTKKQK